MLRAAIAQIRFARDYTISLLDATPTDRWYEIPADGPSHIAWQVGHLAVAQYGLLMFRIRGRQPDDLDLVPGKFRKAYGRGSVPSTDAAGQLSPDRLRERFDAIQSQSLGVLAAADTDTLLQPCDRPYAGYPNNLGSVSFAPLHETIHAGQIGLIRRGLGLDPVR